MIGPISEGERRLRARRLRRLLLLLGGLIVLLIGVAALPQDTRPGGLTVPTDGRIDGTAPVGVVQGVVRAVRAGSRVCFSVDAPAGPTLLVFPTGWSADERLHLRDDAGVVQAVPGQRLAFLGAPRAGGSVPGCPATGHAWSTTGVRRAAATSPTPGP